MPSCNSKTSFQKCRQTGYFNCGEDNKCITCDQADAIIIPGKNRTCFTKEEILNIFQNYNFQNDDQGPPNIYFKDQQIPPVFRYIVSIFPPQNIEQWPLFDKYYNRKAELDMGGNPLPVIESLKEILNTVIDPLIQSNAWSELSIWYTRWFVNQLNQLENETPEGINDLRILLINRLT